MEPDHTEQPLFSAKSSSSSCAKSSVCLTHAFKHNTLHLQRKASLCFIKGVVVSEGVETKNCSTRHQTRKALHDLGKMQTLVIWDFDWSLVNENSDVYVVQQLAPDLMPQFGQLRAEGLGWTQIMAHMMEALWDRGIREQDIVACLAQLPLQPRMIDTVNLINSSDAVQALLEPASDHYHDPLHVQIAATSFKAGRAKDCFDAA
eukprot:16866-Heterococcus_DN1.PRE.2